MTVIASRLLRTGDHEAVSAAEQVYRENAGQTSIWGHVCRIRLTVHWEITAGRDGRRLAEGTAWTKGGAWVKATVAAHNPNLRVGGAR